MSARNGFGLEAARLISEKTGCPARVINDADAAGLAEMKYGLVEGGKELYSSSLSVPGLGTAIFIDGTLLPNTELGHMELDGGDAEMARFRCCTQAREALLEAMAVRFNRYLNMLEKLFSPDLFILVEGAATAMLSTVDI